MRRIIDRTRGCMSYGVLTVAWGAFAAGCGGEGTRAQATLEAVGGAAGASIGVTSGEAGDSGGRRETSNGFGASGAGGEEAKDPELEPGDRSAAGAAGSPDDICVPSPDKPDDDFKDTNCDGIDGDAENAVFVSTDGSDDGAGSMADPVQTLAHAIGLAVEQGKDVYVCNGTYPENLVVSRAVNLYGGYDCSDGWHRVAGRAAVEPPAGIPLSVVAVTEPMELERFAFRAPVALGATGESSQAARVVAARQVRFSRVEFRAEDAADGKAGLDGQAHEVPRAQSGADGFHAPLDDCDMRGSPSAACTEEAPGGNGFPARCSDPFGVYEQRGGKGGHGANGYLSGATCGESVLGEVGQTGTPASSASSKDGSDGGSVQDGVGSSSGFGSLVWGGYTASNSGSQGAPGERGLPGRGGAGGTSTVYYTQDTCEGRYTRGGGGGQGGYGGCAGFPGGGGGGGGGSIGLVIIDSSVTLEDARIITGQGGHGGGAGAGAAGQLGGEPGKGGDGSSASGSASSENAGEDGGRGGAGSRGGHGGAGGGGPSIGIVVVGEQPELSDCSFELGGPGFGAAAVAGPKASDGVASEVYTLTP